MSRIHPSGVRRTISDILELLRLQGRLMALDSREAIKRVLLAVMLACVAIGLTISAGGVLLMGAGWLVSDYFSWSLGPSLLLVGGIAIVVVVLLLLAAYASLRRSATALRDSADEMGANLRWIQNRLVPEGADQEHDPPAAAAYRDQPAEENSYRTTSGNGAAVARSMFWHQFLS